MEKRSRAKRRKLNPNHVQLGNGKILDLTSYLAPSTTRDGYGSEGRDVQPQGRSVQPQGRSEQEPALRSLPKGHSHGAPTQEQHIEAMTGNPTLPIWPERARIRAAIDDNAVLIIVGETGSGKSTQVPQFLYKAPWCTGMIGITQPRRIAATTLAGRVAEEVGTPLSRKERPGKGLVGYSVRFDQTLPKGTKIKFLTEGMLLQELLRDPYLRKYSAIIVDEIHERSIDVDLLCGFLKQLLYDTSGRDGVPLKVVVMSATANVESLKTFFSTPLNDDRTPTKAPSVHVLHIPGRQYPVDISYTPQPLADLRDGLVKAVFNLHIHEALPGDILVFLTGQADIEDVQRLIEQYARDLSSDVPRVKVLPLYGQLSMEAQLEAFRPIKDRHTRKVVLATNIAETSVTVPGVRFVIDCGKAKLKEFRARLGMESLLSKAISKSSAIQRAGRAGREGPGKCTRLYTEEDFTNLEEMDLPEILRTDVLGAVMTMKARGIDDVFTFPLMDMPSPERLEKALFQLHLLGALSESGEITEAGRQMAMYPVPAPYARVLLAATDPQYDCVLEVIDIISLITAGENMFLQVRSEEDKENVEELRKELYRREGDLLTYLTTIQRYAAENADRKDWCKARMISLRTMRLAMDIRKQLRGLCLKEKLLHEKPPPDPQPFLPMEPDRAEDLLKCFLRGFATKTALLSPDKSYATTQGKHVVAVHPSSVLHLQKREAIMFLQHIYTQKNYAKMVSAVRADWIAEALEASG